MRHIYTAKDGTKHLGDYLVRKDPGYMQIAWIVTHHCTMNCPYCIGWKSQVLDDNLITRHPDPKILTEKFLKVGKDHGKKLYIIMSGGEPTLVPGYADLIRSLNDSGIMVELHTNLTNKTFTNFTDKISNPDMIGEVMATYHGWRLNRNKDFRDLYFSNFNLGWDKGLTMVLKMVVPPKDLPTLPDRIKELRKHIPSDAPILPWVFIKGAPKSRTESAGAYPQAYTPIERVKFLESSEYRTEEQRLYMRGAGFFRGMKCGAGESYVYMDKLGNFFPCFGRNAEKPFGNLMAGNVRLNKSPTPCPLNYCGAPFWGLWYGEKPWNFIEKSTDFNSGNSYFNRFGPKD